MICTFGLELKPEKLLMERPRIQRRLLALFMDSPFYFTIPLRRRLEFLKFFSQHSVYNRISEYNEPLRNGKSPSEAADLNKRE